MLNVKWLNRGDANHSTLDDAATVAEPWATNAAGRAGLPELLVQPVPRHRVDARQRRCEHFALLFDERCDSRLRQRQHRRHFLVAERGALGGALQLDEPAL